jgi:hypothetical protein
MSQPTLGPMKNFKSFAFVCAISCAALATPAWSSGLMDSLKSQAAGQLGTSQGSSDTAAGSGLSGLGGAASSGLGGLGLPSIGSNTTSNAAGVIQYCVKNNYLNAASAEGVKDKLLGKVGLGTTQASQDSGYQQGSGGLLQGSDGSSFNLDNIKSNLREKACSYVLDNAKSLL